MTRRRLHGLFTLIFGWAVYAHAWPADAAPKAAVEPRVLIAVYDSARDASPRTTSLHRFLEMPANHLGLDIRYADVQKPLPALNDDDIRGIVLWFDRGYNAPDPEALLRWLEAGLKRNKRLAVLENAGLGRLDARKPGIAPRLAAVYAAMGVRERGRWQMLTYESRIASATLGFINFERALSAPLPPYPLFSAMPGASAHLSLRHGNDAGDLADLVVIGPKGGFAAENYVMYHGEGEERNIDQWYIDPFRFLALSFAAENIPAPDATTHMGRRIFYSHIDGDGWNNLTEISPYHSKNTLASRVIAEEILKRYPGFGFNVGIIAAEMNTDCYGLKESADIARDIFALPNVEAGSHTYSHPLFWNYFRDYTQAKEAPLLNRYPPRPNSLSGYGLFSTADHRHKPPRGEDDNDPLQGYQTPRSYACSTFDLDQEMAGAAKTIQQLLPEGKKVEVLQWSGDTAPFEEAIAAARKAGLANINGGDSRFDGEYPSYASVAPIGLRVGKELQIYSSNSNENTYTNLWTERFFGFRYLPATLKNTETPRRILPFNVYFHMYSGQKAASLKALQENLNYAREQELIPLSLAQYTGIAQGFYTAHILSLPGGGWKIRQHGKLKTIRFDDASQKAVDFARSSGVIGQRWHQGSLYVALDPRAEEPSIFLKIINKLDEFPDASFPYIIESRWDILRMQYTTDQCAMSLKGYGNGTFTLKMPKAGIWHVRLPDSTRLDAATDSEGVLHVSLPESVQAVTPVDITLTLSPGGH